MAPSPPCHTRDEEGEEWARSPEWTHMSLRSLLCLFSRPGLVFKKDLIFLFVSHRCPESNISLIPCCSHLVSLFSSWDRGQSHGKVVNRDAISRSVRRALCFPPKFYRTTFSLFTHENVCVFSVICFSYYFISFQGSSATMENITEDVQWVMDLFHGEPSVSYYCLHMPLISNRDPFRKKMIVK